MASNLPLRKISPETAVPGEIFYALGVLYFARYTALQPL